MPARFLSSFERSRVEQELFLLGVVREIAVRRALLQVLEPLDLLLDRLEVRQRAASQRSVT